MEEKRHKGLLSVLIACSISLFKLPRFIMPLFFLPTVPPTLFSPSPMLDIWGGGDDGWKKMLSPLFPGLRHFPSPQSFDFCDI